MGHSDDLIGGKVLFRFSWKCAPEINVKLGVNERILFDSKEISGAHFRLKRNNIFPPIKSSE